MPHLPDFEAWAIFAKVAEKGSFSQAAEDLGLAKTTVSKAITRLEERMQTSLLHRTTRKLSLTESGRLSLERATRMLSDAAAIEADILEEAAVPRGLIRFAATTSFGVEALAPALPAFLNAYPDIELDLCLTDTAIDIVADGFDLALQIGSGIDSSLRTSRLLTVRRPLMASPEFITHHGRPEHPSDLARFPALVMSHIPSPNHWEFIGPNNESRVVEVNGPLRVNNASAMVASLLAGIGLAAIPEFYVWREVEKGRLVELMPQWSTIPGPLHVVTPPGRARPARVRVLLEYLRDYFATQCWACEVEENIARGEAILTRTAAAHLSTR